MTYFVLVQGSMTGQGMSKTSCSPWLYTLRRGQVSMRQCQSAQGSFCSQLSSTAEVTTLPCRTCLQYNIYGLFWNGKFDTGDQGQQTCRNLDMPYRENAVVTKGQFARWSPACLVNGRLVLQHKGQDINYRPHYWLFCWEIPFWIPTIGWTFKYCSLYIYLFGRSGVFWLKCKFT